MGRYDFDSDAESCGCNRYGYNAIVEYIYISRTRWYLRCKRCKGIVGMVEEEDYNYKEKEKIKIFPPKRQWRFEECLDLR